MGMHEKGRGAGGNSGPTLSEWDCQGRELLDELSIGGVTPICLVSKEYTIRLERSKA